MIAYVPLLLLCIVFFELFVLLKIGRDALAIVQRSHEAMQVMRSPTMSDDEKEVFARRASAGTFLATLRFAAKFLGIGVALYLLFLLTAALFPALKAPMLERLVSPVGIVVLTAITVIYAWLRRAAVRRT